MLLIGTYRSEDIFAEFQQEHEAGGRYGPIPVGRPELRKVTILGTEFAMRDLPDVLQELIMNLADEAEWENE